MASGWRVGSPPPGSGRRHERRSQEAAGGDPASGGGRWSTFPRGLSWLGCHQEAAGPRQPQAHGSGQAADSVWLSSQCGQGSPSGPRLLGCQGDAWRPPQTERHGRQRSGDGAREARGHRETGPPLPCVPERSLPRPRTGVSVASSFRTEVPADTTESSLN